MEWQPIETAPKDGTWILAYGLAYPEYAKRGRWFTYDDNEKRVPFIVVINWHGTWYDKEVPIGDGTYKKEPTLALEAWWPEPHAFWPTHWMPLPEPPSDKTVVTGCAAESRAPP